VSQERFDAGLVPPGARTVPAVASRATRLVLVRHGEATCNITGIVGGRRGCTGLSATGRAQALALRARLLRTRELDGAAALYTSELGRAIETAALVVDAMEPAPDPIADCDLCELHPGSADGLTWDEFRARFGEPDFDRAPERTVAPGGESWHAFVARAAAAVTRVARSHPAELVVIVCHAGVIESTMLSFLPVPPGRRLGLPTEHTSLTEWEHDGDRFRLMRYNDAAHLRCLVG
jgi:2,3-bisphosphoglycerate-dependent phosphoglycerate mutase